MVHQKNGFLIDSVSQSEDAGGGGLDRPEPIFDHQLWWLEKGNTITKCWGCAVKKL